MKPNRQVGIEKPPYCVPSMDAIQAIPWNGFKVASTFSGCGGSCLGYRMAGFRVVWANEFVPIAQESYKANAASDSVLDGRNIKQVSADEILAATGLTAGELDLFDGSPPCQAFSTAGKRHKGWGEVKTYAHGAKQKNEDLIWDYLRLVEGLQPKTFVMENVSGMIKGTVKGVFIEVMQAMKALGYKVSCKVLDAQWLGVPQMRKRVIFVGTRSDLAIGPAYPKPLSYRYTIREALPWIVAGRFGRQGWKSSDRPSPTVSAQLAWHPETSTQGLHLVEAETDMSRYAVGLEWNKLKPGEQSDKYFQLVRSHPDKPCGTITAEAGNASLASVAHPTECRKFSIAELKRICGFPDDFVLNGTYAQQWERLGNSVPPVMMKHIAETIRDMILVDARR